MMKKQLLILMAALSVAGTAAGVSLSLPSTSEAKAEASAVSFDFTDTMDGAAFKAPASNYGWKVTKGALAPDNSIASVAQIGYLEQAIALNEKKYISLDFYASECPMDIMLLPYAETVNPWVETGIGVHCMASGWLRLDTYIDANKGWLADYTGIGNGADGYAHKLEITSDGTNLTFKIDGVDAFTSASVAIPADSVQLVLRAPANSYIDNLYIGAEKPADAATAVDVDFTDKTDLNEFTTVALNGWTGGNGKLHPADAGAMYNASATKLNTPIDLTGKKYISFDFYSTAATFDVGLVDTAAVNEVGATNLWGKALFIHLPFSDGTIGVNDYVDCTAGTYLGGNATNMVDQKAHTMEIVVQGGKVSYTIDGTIVLEGFDVPAASAYLVFRAVGTESYIDNLYIADITPTGVDYDFESVKDADAFTAWNSVGWTAANGGFVANTNWATTQMKQALDLTKNQEIFFDVYLSKTDADKQFNVGFYSEADLPTANTSENGKTYSLGSTLFLGKSFGRNHWIADVGATLYNDTWHSVKITVEDGQMSIAVDGVAYDALTTAIPADTAYLLLQSTNTANVLDNFKIVVEESGETPDPTPDPTPATYTVTFKNWNGDVLQSGAVAEGEIPVYAGETPVKAEDDFNTYTFKGWDKELLAVTGDVEYVAQYDATAKEPPVMESLDLDFSAAAHADNFVAYGGSAGWSVSGGVFKPNANWATVNTGKVLDLTKDQQITFDVYLSSSEASDINRQFNVGFFATTNADTNTQAGSGVNYSLGATMYYGSSFGRTQWVADVAANLYNDSVHAVKVTVQGGKLSVSVDGTAYDTLTADIPAEKVFLLLQSTSTETYVDNLKIGDIVEEVPEVNPYEGIFEKYGSGAGWSYKSEKLSPNAAWSVMNTVNAIDFTKNQEITFNVYLSEADADKQFNVGFFETKVEETNKQPNTGLCFSFGATIWVSTNFGRNGWASECVKDYFDNSLHSVKLTIVNKEITLSVDGEVLYFLTNGASYTPTLTVDSAYLLMQATSTETYVQNYAVQEVAAAPKTYTVTFKNWNGDVLQSGSLEEGSMPVYTGATPVKPADENYTYAFSGWDKELSAVTGDVEYVAQFEATEHPDEFEMNFTEELDGTTYFTTLDSNGWSVKDGYFMPEYMPWSSTYLSQPVDMSGEKYISFDFLAVKDNFDATQSQFNIMFLTDLKKFTCSGAIHCFMESTTPVLTVNRAMGKDKWVGTASFNWADGKMHNMMIIIKDGTIKFEVDGQPVLDNQLGTQIVIELTDEQQAKETYFGLQATNVMTRIDNFKVKNTYTEYVAPTPEEEIAFEELEQSFVAGEETGFVQYNDSVNWTVNADGQFAPSTNWAKAYLDKQIPLTQEKTVTMKLCLSTAESGHQFTVGFSMDKNSYYGVYLVFYQGTVSLNYGTAPQVRLITQTNNVWYDGEEHVLKMIVKNEKLAILIDGEVIFKDVQVAMKSGYLTVQSSTTQDWIDDLTIINDAEPLSKPQPDGDIATPPVDSSVNNQVSGEVVEKSKGCSSFMGVAICPLTLAAAAVLVAKKKNKKE